MRKTLESLKRKGQDLPHLQRSDIIITYSDHDGTLTRETFSARQFSLMGFGAIMRLGSLEPLDISYSDVAQEIENDPKSSNQGLFSKCNSRIELQEGCLLKMQNDYPG